MNCSVAVVTTLLILLVHPVWAQQQSSQTDGRIAKTVGSVRLKMDRDYHPYASPGQFSVSVVLGKGGVRGVFRGVCAESLSVELTVTGFAQYDKDAYLRSRSGADLPIAEPLNVMKDALVEKCGQLQVIRVRGTSVKRGSDDIDYRGTMTRADDWHLQDGIISTSYDESHRFILRYRDRHSVIGVYLDGVCEEEPLLLLEPQPTGAERAKGYSVNFTQFIEVARSVAVRYSEECPRTSRIQYILAPLPQNYWCVEGHKLENKCFLVAIRKPETREWEIDRTQVEYFDYGEPIKSVDDVAEVLAAGEFRILQDYNPYLAMYFEGFLNAYSTNCRSHIREPVEWTYAAKPAQKWVDGYGNVVSEFPGTPAHTIVIEAGYRRALNRYSGTWEQWALRNLDLGSFIGGGQRIRQSVSRNCTDDRIQTIYQNMYNVAYSEPAIKGKYTTDKKPLFRRPPHISSAPARTEAILAERKARAQRNKQLTRLASAQPIPNSRAQSDIEPEAQETLIRRPSTDVDIDYVVSNMARTAGRLQAIAELCSGESEAEIRATFVTAGSNKFPEQTAAIEQAYDQHYEKRRATLAKKRKAGCREKEHRRMSKENASNLELLANGESD